MAVSPLIWRKMLMDSIRGNLGYYMREGACRKNPWVFETLLNAYQVRGEFNFQRGVLNGLKKK
jgi:hypothetical protein